MLPIKHTACTRTGELLQNAQASIAHFGFVPLEHTLKHSALATARSPKRAVHAYTTDEKKSVRIAEQLHLANEHVETPIACAYHVETPRAVATNKSCDIYLHSTSPDAIGETLTIASIVNTLRHSGVAAYKLYINSIGDADSYARFLQSVREYVRTHVRDLPVSVHNYALAGDMVRTYNALMRTEHATVAPNPMEFLNDDSRQRFRDVLEHMDLMGIEYEIDARMVGSPECCAHTLFEFRIPEDTARNETVIARGGRYHQNDTRYTLTSARMSFERKGRIAQRKHTISDDAPFFVTCLGTMARVKGITILSELFDAGIPVRQSLTETHIAEQMQHARRAEAQYIIIVGHKEALENTAMVRRVADNAQTVVPLPRLVGYLKRLKVS